MCINFNCLFKYSLIILNIKSINIDVFHYLFFIIFIFDCILLLKIVYILFLYLFYFNDNKHNINE